MPDRIIKESICISDTLNQLTDFEERFWHRLTVNCDDFGRFDARPAVLKGRLFPLMDGKTQKNMTDALNKLASVGLIELYEVDGRPFLHVVTWDKYQRIRAKRSRFPSPDDDCRQMTSNVPVIQSNPIRIQSNPSDLEVSSLRSETSCAAGAARGDISAVVSAWNSLGLSQVRDIKPDSPRYPLLRKRLQDYGLEDVLSAIENVRKSPFLQGQNRNGWVITFDWFIGPKNFAKVLEGNYSEKKSDRDGNVFLDMLREEENGGTQ